VQKMQVVRAVADRKLFARNTRHNGHSGPGGSVSAETRLSIARSR